MIDLLAAGIEMLQSAGFAAERSSINNREALIFENSTVLGFLFGYNNPPELLGAWVGDAKRAVADHQLGLRRAGQKAWNTYIVLLSAESADHRQSVALAEIEEDLTGTRKIARSGIRDSSDLRAALLPLLPLQSAPKLEAVDIADEIRQRTTQLPSRAVDAFLSNAEESLVLQVLEQES
jgi:hypothetical protein